MDALSPLFGERFRWALSPTRSRAKHPSALFQNCNAIVFYNSNHTREEIVRHGIVDESRLIHAPLGVSAEFTPDGPIDKKFDGLLPRSRFLLHVGSGIPRKRLDLLIRVLALLRAKEPDLVLVQQGARLTNEHRRLLDTLKLVDAVVQFPKLNRTALAQLYRRAALVVLPSEREGFGLPVVEALACGAQVLASDIPAFRELGTNVIDYCNDSEPFAWAERILRLLEGERPFSSAADRVARAACFGWSSHARIVLDAYIGALV